MRKKALITGASRGIGEAIAKELAGQGFDLMLTCLNSLDRLKELTAGLEKNTAFPAPFFREIWVILRPWSSCLTAWTVWMY